MRLSQMAATLERELCSASDASVFHDARGHHEALAPYESPDDVLAALSAESRASNGDKDAITRALVAEYQTSRGPLWHAILVLAYMPMLVRISNRIRLDIRDPGERDQLVLTAFWETLRSISTGRRWMCLSLRRCTEQRVFRSLGRERKDRQCERAAGAGALEHHATRAASWVPDAESLWPAMRSAEKPGDDDQQDIAARAALLAQIARVVLDHEERELLLATLVRGERLTDHVRRLHPDHDEPEWRREYQRSKRRHSRALAKLRAHLQRDQRQAGENEDVEPDIADAAAAEWPERPEIIKDEAVVDDVIAIEQMALVA